MANAKTAGWAPRSSSATLARTARIAGRGVRPRRRRLPSRRHRRRRRRRRRPRSRHLAAAAIAAAIAAATIAAAAIAAAVVAAAIAAAAPPPPPSPLPLPRRRHPRRRLRRHRRRRSLSLSPLPPAPTAPGWSVLRTGRRYPGRAVGSAPAFWAANCSDTSLVGCVRAPQLPQPRSNRYAAAMPLPNCSAPDAVGCIRFPQAATPEVDSGTAPSQMAFEWSGQANVWGGPGASQFSNNTYHRSWVVDLDQDGRTEFIVCGSEPGLHPNATAWDSAYGQNPWSLASCKVYFASASGSGYTELRGTALDKISRGSLYHGSKLELTFADYDNDRFPDVAVCGLHTDPNYDGRGSSNNYLYDRDSLDNCELYRNTCGDPGLGCNLTDVPRAFEVTAGGVRSDNGRAEHWEGKVVFGDYDSDGFVDALIFAQGRGGDNSRPNMHKRVLLHNNRGNGTFSEVPNFFQWSDDFRATPHDTVWVDLDVTISVIVCNRVIFACGYNYDDNGASSEARSVSERRRGYERSGRYVLRRTIQRSGRRAVYNAITVADDEAGAATRGGTQQHPRFSRPLLCGPQGSVSLLIVNGANQAEAAANELFVNEGNWSFVLDTEGSIMASRAWASGAAFCDLDGDGWLDVVVMNANSDPEVHMSEGNGRGLSHAAPSVHAQHARNATLTAAVHDCRHGCELARSPDSDMSSGMTTTMRHPCDRRRGRRRPHDILLGNALFRNAGGGRRQFTSSVCDQLSREDDIVRVDDIDNDGGEQQRRRRQEHSNGRSTTAAASTFYALRLSLTH